MATGEFSNLYLKTLYQILIALKSNRKIHYLHCRLHLSLTKTLCPLSVALPEYMLLSNGLGKFPVEWKGAKRGKAPLGIEG